ncbi:hypothetical protein [Sunxiuqinia indica]|uniref:hypothetical protein n=1 Tax=Sunxiuqinia indica TaxID=2692584 RepID=UPI00135AF178|nr:hypothetical protein [Sunxiuqinia indica]
MTVAKVTSASYGNLGVKGTRKDNEMVSIDGVILTTSDFAPSIADLALEATWIAGIRAGTVMPLNGLDSYEDQSSDDTIYESALGNRKLLKRGKTRMMFQLDIPLSVHRTLQQDYNNADLTYWPLRDGKICFYNDGGVAKGFSTDMINIGRMKEVPADGSTPAFTPLYLDMDNYREWDMYGEFIEPTWEANDLEPLIDVDLEVVGTPTASEIIVRVFGSDGVDSDGSVKKIGIKGIVESDWQSTAGVWTAETGFTDNGDGTYTFASAAAFSTGTMDLKTPANMVSDGLLIKSTGAATVTIA